MWSHFSSPTWISSLIALIHSSTVLRIRISSKTSLKQEEESFLGQCFSNCTDLFLGKWWPLNALKREAQNTESEILHLCTPQKTPSKAHLESQPQSVVTRCHLQSSFPAGKYWHYYKSFRNKRQPCVTPYFDHNWKKTKKTKIFQLNKKRWQITTSSKI